CQFAFLDELFDEGMVHAGGHVPINRAHVVAGLILTHLVEIHALALEDAVVLAGERFADEPVRADFNLSDFFENFAGNHRNAERATWNAESRGAQSPRLRFGAPSRRTFLRESRG